MKVTTGILLVIIGMLGAAGAIYAVGDLLVASYENRDVRLYDSKRGSFEGIFITTQSYGLGYLVFGPDGNLYASVHGDDKIKRFNGSTGAYIDDFVSGDSNLDGPAGMRFGRDGNLYVVSNHTQKILRYDGETGSPMGKFADAILGVIDITFGPDGNLYVGCGRPNNVVRVYDGNDGHYLDGRDIYCPNWDHIWGLEFDKNGNLYVVSNQTNEVFRYDGNSCEVFIPSTAGLNAPQILTFDPAYDFLYVVGYQSNNVVRSDGVTHEVVICDVNQPTALVFKLLSVLSPDGGENWAAGTIQNIQWETSGDVNIPNVHLEYSTNNGQAWNDVNTVPNTGLYEWNPVPTVDLNQCLVRISDLSNPNIYDTSDKVFTIFQCTNPIQGDLNGDCYVDFRDFAIVAEQWLKCGNPFDPACQP